MNIVDGLSELKAACEKATMSDRDTLESGETAWLLGHPSSADNGTVALQVGAGQTITVKESDVLEVKKFGARFGVKIKRHAPIAFKLELICEVGASNHPCNCANGENDSSQNAPNTRMARIGSGPNLPATWNCYALFREFSWADGDGGVVHFYLPLVHCYRVGVD